MLSLKNKVDFSADFLDKLFFRVRERAILCKLTATKVQKTNFF